MDTTGSTSTLAPKTTRRNFYQWAVKWFYTNLPEDTSKKSDIPSIICLLQAVGFQLREFEKRSSVNDKDEEKTNSIRITMECFSSKMTAVLEMDDVKCKCPDNNVAKDGSFWSITGTAPTDSVDNVNKFEETGSNLLPDMSKEKTGVVRDVVHRLLKLINNNHDDDHPIDSNVQSPAAGGLVRSYTDFYEHKPRTVAILNSNLANAKCMSSSKSIKDIGLSEKKKLIKQETYDIKDNNESNEEEPRSLPPKLASSPVFDHLCSSLGQISPASEDEPLSLADYVVQAHQILDKAMNFILNIPNQSFSMDDGNFAKPAAPPSLMSSSFCSSSRRRTKANNMMNRSVSNASTRSFASSTSSESRLPPSGDVQKSMTGQMSILPPRIGGLPPMRDRSSSLNAAQRPQSSLRTLAGQRRSANAASTLALTPRPKSANSKLPASKLTQSRVSAAGLTAERTTLMAKRRSLEVKSQTSSSALSSRGNVSLIKAPASVTQLNNSSVSAKYGFVSAKT